MSHFADGVRPSLHPAFIFHFTRYFISLQASPQSYIVYVLILLPRRSPSLDHVDHLLLQLGGDGH